MGSVPGVARPGRFWGNAMDDTGKKILDDMTTPAIVNAPPLAERPKCKWCQQALKPNYETADEAGEMKWRKIRYEEMSERYPTSDHDDPKDPNGTPYVSGETEYREGCWRVKVRTRKIKVRRWKGTYTYVCGWFCCGGCAQEWARANATAIFERGETISSRKFYVRKDN